MAQTPNRFPNTFHIALIGLVGGIVGAVLFDLSGLRDKIQGETTREYLLANPEVLPQALDVLRDRQSAARIEPARAQLENAYPGAVLGNPQGSITLVEFSDYACGYCRASVADVEKLVAGHPELKIVVREYPILTEGSANAARMALAAADQGRFAQFHKAMFGQGNPTPQTIDAAAKEAGLDLAAAKTAIAAGTYEFELGANVDLARELGFDGTPSWVIGNQGFSGAVGVDALGDAIAKAQSADTRS